VVFEQLTEEVGAPGFAVQVRGSTLELKFDVVFLLAIGDQGFNRAEVVV